MGTARLRDLIILLPGITGTVLQKDGREIWGTSRRFFWDAVRTRGELLRQLTLAEDDPSVDALADGITATRLVPDATIVPGLMKIDGYTATSQMIRDRFKIEEGTLNDRKPANFIEFPYDWRRDNRVAARHLKALVDVRLPQWRKYSGANNAKVIFVAHSMGGLVARYYLEVLEGWPNCRLLISLGTPYRGSLNALNFLANGYKQLTMEMSEPMRSFTSIYQLLPTYKALQVGLAYRRLTSRCSLTDCAECQRNEPAPSGPLEPLEIPGIDMACASDALKFHHEIMNAVERHRNESAYRDDGYRIIPVVGTRQPTHQSGELRSGRVTVGGNLPAGFDSLLAEGDGTVPRLSAIPVELSDDYRQSFFAERHGSLQRNETVLAHVRGTIEQAQVVGLKEIRSADVDPQAATFPALSITLDDLYVEGEPIRIRAQMINMPVAGAPRARLQAMGSNLARDVEFQPDSDGWIAEVVGLTPDAYRVDVSAPAAGGSAPLPVHDLFEVAPNP